MITDRTTRRFRFSLRTLFVVVTVLGAGIGWFVVQLKWIQNRHEALNRLHHTRQHVTSGFLAGGPSPWSIRILGEPGYGSIDWVRVDASDATMAAELERLFPESQVLPMDEIQYFEHHPHWHNGRRVKTKNPLTFP